VAFFDDSLPRRARRSVALSAQRRMCRPFFGMPRSLTNGKRLERSALEGFTKLRHTAHRLPSAFSRCESRESKSHRRYGSGQVCLSTAKLSPIGFSIDVPKRRQRSGPLEVAGVDLKGPRDRLTFLLDR
jgi:hypothetical protein